MAPKRRLRSDKSVAAAADTSSDFQPVQGSTENPVAPAPPEQEIDGAGRDEVRSSDEVRTERSPPPKRMAVAKKNVASLETSPRKRKKGTAAAPAAEISGPPPLAAQVARSPSPEKAATAAASGATKSAPPKKAAALKAAKSPPPKNAATSPLKMKSGKAAAPATERSPSPEKAATAAASGSTKSPTPKKKKKAASKAAKSPPRKRKKAAVAEKMAAAVAAANLPGPDKTAARTEVAGTPPPTGTPDRTTNATPVPGAAASAGAEKEVLPAVGTVAEKHLGEKRKTYWYLWQMVLSLENEFVASLKEAFLKLDDLKASILNTELKKMHDQVMRQQLWWMDTTKEVFEVMINLIK